MKRTLLLIGILTGSIFASGAVIDSYRFSRDLGNFLELIFGSMREEDVVAIAGLVGLAASSLTMAICMAIPSWRPIIRASIVAWPLKNQPIGSYFLKTATLAIGGMVVLSVMGGLRDGFDATILALLCILFLAVLLHDFRLLMIGDDSVPTKEKGETTKANNTAGWVLPSTIDQSMLGKPELRLELARDLRSRAIQLRRFSMISLVAIGMLLFVAVGVILFAGFIANLGIGQSNIERIQATLDSEQAILARVERDLRGIDSRERSVKTNYERRMRITKKPIVEGAYKKSSEYERLMIQRDQLKTLRGHHVKTLETIFAARQKFLEKRLTNNGGAQGQPDNINLLIASGITRFGILFIMLFIVQILVNLYRYTMRLSSYYLSQADALLLSDGTSDDLLKIVPALSPATVDFGKPPATPIEHVEKLVNMMGKAKQAGS
jgi:hypothetical protein